MGDPISLFERPRARYYAVVVTMWLVVLAIFVVAARVLLPFELALLFAYVIHPIISGIARRRVFGHLVPRWVAVLLVYALLATVLWIAAVSVLPQVYSEVVRGLTQTRDALTQVDAPAVSRWAQRVQVHMDRFGVPVELVPGAAGTRPHVTLDIAAVLADALSDATSWLRAQVGDVLGLSRALLGGVVRSIFFVVLLIMITAFISMDAPRIMSWMERLVPRTLRADWERLIHEIDRTLAGVVRGQLTVCLLNGTLTLIGLLVLRIPFPFALAALATVLYLLPIFGTIISTAPVVLLALTGGGPSKALLALGLILGIHALEAYILNPKILGDAARIHPVLIVLALVVGEHYFGLVGALLAFPTAGIVASVFKFMQWKAAQLEARLDAAEAPPRAPRQAGP